MDVLPSASDIAQLVEFGDAEAYADMFAAAPHDLCLRVERIGSAFMLVADQIDVMLCNRVIGLGVKEPATEVMVDAILTAYQRAGIRNFALQISPIAQPAALAEWLPVRHLIRADNWAKVYRAPAAADVPEHPNPSFHNMIRTGFVLAYQRPNYLWQAG